MKKIYFVLIMLVAILHNNGARGQCSASINYSTGANGLVNFTSNITGSGWFYYEWDFGDTAIAYSANPSHYYWYNATYNACVVITDSLQWCSDTACIPVTVTNANQYALCPGNAAFSAVPNGTHTLFTNTSGTWTAFDFGDGTTANGTVFNHQYPFNGTFQVTAIAYSYFGSNFLPCDTSTQTITVTNVPCDADFYLYADTSGYVSASNQSFGFANVTWYIDGVVFSSNTNDINTILLPGTHDICLAITGPGGCSDSTCQSVTLNYTPQCSVTFSDSLLSGCDTYQFAVNNAGPPLTSINWYLDGTWISSAATFPLTLDFTSSQNIYSHSMAIHVTGAGCASAQSWDFYNPAGFGIWLDWDTTSGSGNIWYAYPLFNTGVTYELWDFGDGTTSTFPYPTHVYVVAGYYNVCHTVTLNGACTYTYCVNQYFFRGTQSQSVSTFIVVGPTGMAEETEASGFILFPNPTSGDLNIDYPISNGTNYLFVMRDLAGRKIVSEILNGKKNHAALKTDHLRAGTYFYEIYDGSKRVKNDMVMIVR